MAHNAICTGIAKLLWLCDDKDFEYVFTDQTIFFKMADYEILRNLAVLEVLSVYTHITAFLYFHSGCTPKQTAA